MTQIGIGFIGISKWVMLSMLAQVRGQLNKVNCQFDQSGFTLIKYQIVKMSHKRHL